MYISIPDAFFVQIYYVEEYILNIGKTVKLQECNFMNQAIKRKDLVIGISLPTQRDGRWVRSKENMEKYAELKGVTVKVENADTDVAKQVERVQFSPM